MKIETPKNKNGQDLQDLQDWTNKNGIEALADGILLILSIGL
jgi:hypothetical protein